jgi:hypothetical protein
MSSCVVSCCTYCRVASSVSGTSASSPVAVVGRWFHFASNCFRSVHPRRRRHRLTPTHDPIRLRSGPARYAAALCLWSSASLLFRSSSVLHRKAKLPEMLKPTYCRPSNASASGRYPRAYAMAILQPDHSPIIHSSVLRPELHFLPLTTCTTTSCRVPHRAVQIRVEVGTYSSPIQSA